jgi:hypothetical protein
VEFEIIWGGDPEDASVTTWGTATLEGLSAWVQEGFSDPRYRPGMRILVDHSRLDWSGISQEDVHKRVEHFAKAVIPAGRACAAVVMRAPVDFGIARMVQAYVEVHPELEIEIAVFLSIEDAREWLREQIAEDAGSADSTM